VSSSGGSTILKALLCVSSILARRFELLLQPNPAVLQPGEQPIEVWEKLVLASFRVVTRPSSSNDQGHSLAALAQPQYARSFLQLPEISP
jgi:hypothetical protein